MSDETSEPGHHAPAHVIDQVNDVRRSLTRWQSEVSESLDILAGEFDARSELGDLLLATQRRADEAERSAEEAMRRARDAERTAEAATRRADEATARLFQVEGSVRFKLAQALARPLDRLRSRRRQTSRG